VTTEPRPPTLTILLLLSAALLVAFFSGYELLDRVVLAGMLSGEARELLHGLSGITGSVLLTIFVGWYMVSHPVHAPRRDHGITFFDSRERRVEQLRWLVRMRWIAAAFSLALIVITVPLMGVEPPDELPALLAWLGIMVVGNLVFARALEHDENFDRQIMAQMTVDTIVVTGLLNASGGIENPLLIAYLFGVFIAAVLLPKGKALVITLTAASALTFLVLGELFRILPHAEVRLMPPAAHNPVFVLARLTSILAVMFLTSYFTTMVMDRLRESESELRDSAIGAMIDRHRLEAVIESAGFGMLVVDARGRIAWMNHRLGAWMQWDDAMIGSDCPHDHGEGRVCFACAALETLASGQPRETEVRDNAPRHFRHATFPVRNTAGEVVQAVHVVEEITSRKELESQALHASGLAVLGQLAAGVAHEIGNPLSSLAARVQLMKRHPDPAAIAESLDVLEKQIDRMGRIVRGVSHLARDRFDSRGMVDADAVVREAISLVRFDRRAARVDIRDELRTLPPVRGIRDELLQVVLNLLFNAVEAMPDGGSIVTRTFTDNGHVRIAVRDSGPGIDASVRARLFEPFFTTKNNGTGLGLSICRSLVHANGGTIEVESEPGSGAQFTIVLPAWSAA
jgi:signal transduction histidine kinase